MEGQVFRASSAMSFNGVTLSPLNPPSEVNKTLHLASFILAANALEENPAKTTE